MIPDYTGGYLQGAARAQFNFEDHETGACSWVSPPDPPIGYVIEELLGEVLGKIGELIKQAIENLINSDEYSLRIAVLVEQVIESYTADL